MTLRQRFELHVTVTFDDVHMLRLQTVMARFWLNYVKIKTVGDVLGCWESGSVPLSVSCY